MRNYLGELQEVALKLERAEATAKQLRKERDKLMFETYGLPRSESVSQAKMAEATGLSQKQVSLILKRGFYNEPLSEEPPDIQDPEEKLKFLLELRSHGVSILEISKICEVTKEYVVHCLNHYGGERIPNF